jgi:hypothetical protein
LAQEVGGIVTGTKRRLICITGQFIVTCPIIKGRYGKAANALINAYTYDPGWAKTYYGNTTYGIQ